MTSNKILEWELRSQISAVYDKFGWIVAETFNDKLNEILRNNPMSQVAFIALDKEITTILE